MIRILVIDPEPHARLTMRSMLVGAGYEVDLAADGCAAESAFARHPADLVIADAEEEAARLPTRLLAVPGGDPLRRRELGGVTNVLPKPFGRDDLLAAVRVTLGAIPPVPGHS
ncbi:hypothetical protein [Magnetospirillum sp. UT-4]|uniref:hypothetical protein n=1 Tax=Magnetospirillum sp. UT-4 TaxID=2681467 RepID=UPI001383595A|nr:hypothetical protein [Magnetospirillum sp. UT-4]CAA7625600.1 Response regulator receiver [Magnetospirillum sp. UT-4]